uniref:RNA helicase n=1 Tax=Globisporangium ultimum (strain ATCC 200006 / CBS 805.95 / DAOM BR144) TaxID=431595 RepID=K3X9X4_GLOUD
MASSFFGALTQGAKFDTKRYQQQIGLFKKQDDSAKKNSKSANDSALDFFGFDAAKETKPVEKKPKQRDRKLSVDMVPNWAGNEVKAVKKKSGSKQSRKRKLSEGAIEEQKLEDDERKQASMLLAPKLDKAQKRKLKKQAQRKARAESIGSEVSELRADTEDDSENDDEDNDVTLFKGGKNYQETDESTKKSGKSAPKASKDSDEIALFRRQMNIRVEGTAVPAPIAEFEKMRMSAQQEKMKAVLLKNIEASEYKEPTPIQMQAIPSMLLGRDVLATAPTGSGKTAAFAIPILANLGTPAQEGIRSIVLSPTRELAVQIHTEFTRLCKGRKFHIVLLSKATAATIAAQIKSKCTVNHDILIATPLRLVHLIQETKIDLSMVEIVCLDEADRLFDMGFVEQIDEIFAACTHPKIQRAMFSATMLQGVEEMAQSVLRDPIKVSIGVKNAGATTIEQKLVFVGKEEGKIVAMKQLITEGLRVPALLFVQNKERANELYQELLYDGINVGAVHADRTKEQRDEVIRQFRTGAVWVLICTDLMSRGMDFKAVNMVINYDFPQSAVSYIHRIGRTGRGGRQGLAVTFFTEDDMVYLRTIANVMKLSGCDVPEWMLSLKKASMKKRKELLKAPPQRHRINTVSGYDLQKSNRIKQSKSKGATKEHNGNGGAGDASLANEKVQNVLSAPPRKKQKFPERGGKKKSNKKRNAQSSE